MCREYRRNRCVRSSDFEVWLNKTRTYTDNLGAEVVQVHLQAVANYTWKWSSSEILRMWGAGPTPNGIVLFLAFSIAHRVGIWPDQQVSSKKLEIKWTDTSLFELLAPRCCPHFQLEIVPGSSHFASCTFILFILIYVSGFGRFSWTNICGLNHRTNRYMVCWNFKHCYREI
jgi:hypothetical protein